jgi:hypothetical protein
MIGTKSKLSDYLLLELETIFVEGEGSISFLDDEDFKWQWEQLLLKVGYGSVFQTPSFVLPWYNLNRQEFSPVVLAAYAEGRLVGLLTLARKLQKTNQKPCKKLVGAGNYFALYQTWLVEQPFSLIFWEKGISRILNEIPGCLINLKSIPNMGVFNEIYPSIDFRKNSVLEKFLNPVLDFSDEGHNRILSKRHFKSKINRLNRAGKVFFEQVESEERFVQVFPKIASFHALRQGAAFNKIPFPSEGKDFELFTSWLKEGVLHVTCLWLNEELISAVIVVNDFGRSAHLAGLITYSASHAKLSPGLVHLHQLVSLLKSNNFENLKLSPGYDSYKDRFSNRDEEIFELLISRNRFELLKRRLRVLLRNFLLKKGIRPMALEVVINKWKSKVNKMPNRFLCRLKVSPNSLSHILAHLAGLNKSGNSIGLEWSQGNLNHLLSVDDKTLDITRWEFLADALARLGENEHFFTCTMADQLLTCIWYTGEKIYSPGDLLKKWEDKQVTKVWISSHYRKTEKTA